MECWLIVRHCRLRKYLGYSPAPPAYAADKLRSGSLHFELAEGIVRDSYAALPGRTKGAIQVHYSTKLKNVVVSGEVVGSSATCSFGWRGVLS